MKKSERIENLLAAGENSSNAAERSVNIVDNPCYTGWFVHFNAGEFYTAHDVLEHLWLKTEGENWAFFKGLIQLAGAFVHLKKQFERPDHPKDGRRIQPAARLFDLARKNLAAFPPVHLRLDVYAVCRVCEEHARFIRDFNSNPWNPERPLSIHLTDEAPIQ